MDDDRRMEKGCRYDLTIAAVFQDEGRYLKEWIEFHRMVGVQRFVLVDDRSTDDYRRVLAPYLAAGIVELHVVPCPARWRGRAWEDFQCTILDKVCAQLRGVTRWLALIDIDEFIVPTRARSVLPYLRKHEACGAVYIRWEPFGTSYHPELAPGELLTERMVLKWKRVAGAEMLGKSIVKPHRVLRANIHRSELMPGYEYADSNPDMRSASPPIKVNHYWSRDEKFLRDVKLPRAARVKGWKITPEKREFHAHLFNDVPDHGMQRFIPELRRRVFAVHAPDAHPRTARGRSRASRTR